MSNRVLFFLCFLFVVLSSSTFSQEAFKYISPKDNAVLVSLKTNIILRTNDKINNVTLKDFTIRIKGGKSGIHQGDLKLSDDGKTILFILFKPFSADEIVTVKTGGEIETLSGKKIKPVSFSFKTTPLEKPQRFFNF